jgi:hypothetical protein
MGLSSRQRRRIRSSLDFRRGLWQTSTPTTKLSKCWVYIRILLHVGTPRWVQFSNGVSLNTHKEFALEILTTTVLILDEGVLSLSFRLEGVEQVVPYEYIREFLGFQKGAPKQVGVHGSTLEGFWSMITGEDHQ